MDAYIALFPMPARLSSRHSLHAARVLLDEAEPSAEVAALSLSLLHTSWAKGQQPLAAHLKRMKKALDAQRFHDFTTHTAFSSPASDLNETHRALEAQTAVGAWVQLLLNDDRDLATIWQSAVVRATAKLNEQSSSPSGVAALHRLVELLSDGHAEEVASTEGFLPPPADERPPRVPRVQASQTTVESVTEDMQRVASLARVTARRVRQAPLTNLVDQGAETALTGPKILLWQKRDAQAMLSRMQGTGAGEANGRQLALLKRMAEEDGWRVLKEVPAPGADVLLDRLQESYPHFGAVLEFVRNSLALAGCGTTGSPALFPPILLRGPAGTGKTSFSQELARILELKFVERDLSVMSEAFVINGNDAAWKGSKPGVVFESLVHGSTANPLILLNEVDKAAIAGSHNSPIAPMFGLLEPTSASSFADEFLPVSLDASRVNWILTANEGEIPQPVLSRLEEFEIPYPTTSECRAIAASIWATLTSRALPEGHGFAADLSDAVLDQLSSTNPRTMRKALTHAAGVAVSCGRRSIHPADLEAGAGRYAESRKGQIGFVR